LDSGTCLLCRRTLPKAELRSVESLGPRALAELRDALGGAPDPAGSVCRADLARVRRHYVEAMLEAERGELSALDREVLSSLEAGETVAANVTAEFEGRRSVGERAADALAAFGGSWTFILIFGAVLVAWMALNTSGLVFGFDPFPYILLNLVLSTLAALQAPVIMMSQRRQEARDRLRAENDYKVNLKAELEIRHLHEKIDHQLARQWERLAEMQRLQIEMLEEIASAAEAAERRVGRD
jgi:uncharacterized membrane protein